MSILVQQVFFWSALAYWVAGFFLIWRIPVIEGKGGGEINGPGASSSLFTTADLSVVIPARNEAENIGTLLESLRGQSGLPREIIVVDDQSEDGTGEIVEGFAESLSGTRLRVVIPEERPEDWTGKNWSCHSGMLQAGAPLLLFLDADTRLSSPEALEMLVEEYNRRGGLLSVQPYHVVHKAYEQLSGFFNMIVMVGTNAFSIWSRSGESDGCFGPCILTSKAQYLRVGGHEAVRGQVVDDLALCRLYRREGIPVHTFGGKGVINFRMYPGGVGSMIEGWTKNMAVGASLADVRLILLLIIWCTGISNAALALGSLGWRFDPTLGPMILGAYALYGGQIFLQLRRVGSFRWVAALLFPVLFLFFVGIFIYSVVRVKIYRSVSWKGRSIRID